MAPITALFLRLPLVSGTLVSVAVAAALLCATGPDVGACSEELLVPAEAVAIASPAPDVLRLELEVEQATSGCMYYSSFDVGPVEVANAEPSRILHRRFAFLDGCDWESEERLERVSDGVYSYTYTERSLECAAGHQAATACTRSGRAVTSANETPANEGLSR